MSGRKCAYAGLIAVLFLLPVIASCITIQASRGKISTACSEGSRISSQVPLNHLTDENISVIIQGSHLISLDDLGNLVLQTGGRVRARFDALNFLSVTISPAIHAYLVGLGVQIYPDRQFRACMEVSVEVVKPSSAWSNVETFFGYPVNGSGVTVAVLDTGINFHDDLNDLDDNNITTDPKVIAEYDFISNSSVATDNNKHGTHVAGIVSGTGEFSGGARVGVAPGCWLLDGKILDADGVGDETTLLRGILWAIANGSDVISLSLATTESGDGSDPFSQAVAYAVSQGVVVVVAAGNPDPPNKYEVLQPGVCPDAITVGALDRTGSSLYSKSPSGPTYDFRMKPDILAPGVGIISCDNDTSGYLTKTGTSQATAHVAGAAALILQIHPSWTPQQVKDALISNALPMGLDPYTQGGGRLDISTAINTSVLLDSVADFQLFGSESIASQTVTVTNLKAYPLTVQYTASKYTLNQSSPFVIPASSSRGINISVNVSDIATHRYWEYINFSVEGKSPHLIAVGIKPTLTVTHTSSLLYNTSIHLNLTTALDIIPIDFLNDSYLRIDVDGIPVTQIAINGSGNVSTTLANASWVRGQHGISTHLYINNTYMQTVSDYFAVYGYNSSLAIANVAATQWINGQLSLSAAENVSGPIHLYIDVSGGWQHVTTINSPTVQFDFPANFNPGTYQIKVVFEGDDLYEPCEATATLTIHVNFNPLYITLAIVVGAVVGVGLVVQRRRRQRAQFLREQDIQGEGEKKRSTAVMYRDLNLEAGRSKYVMMEPTVLPGGAPMKPKKPYKSEPAIHPVTEEPELAPTIKPRSDPEQDADFTRRVAQEQFRVTVQAKIDWFRDRGKWEDAVSYIREILDRDDLHSKVRETCHFHLGDILLTQGKIREAVNLLQNGIEDVGCRTTRIFDLLITIFDPEHYDDIEKEATYREMRKRAMKIEGFFE